MSLHILSSNRLVTDSEDFDPWDFFPWEILSKKAISRVLFLSRYYNVRDTKHLRESIKKGTNLGYCPKFGYPLPSLLSILKYLHGYFSILPVVSVSSKWIYIHPVIIFTTTLSLIMYWNIHGLVMLSRTVMLATPLFKYFLSIWMICASWSQTFFVILIALWQLSLKDFFLDIFVVFSF